jgi:glycogen operon protein
MVRFVRELVALRRGNPTLRRRNFLVGGTSATGSLPDVEWFSPEGVHIDWYAADGSLACFFAAPDAREVGDGVPRHVLVFAHAGSAPKTFLFPQAEPLRALPWRSFIDTGRPPPADIHPAGEGPLIDVRLPLELSDRALVCLLADAQPPSRPLLAGPGS